MRRLYPILTILLVFTLFGASSSSLKAQCVLQTNWTFNPPIPPTGAYDAGTTVEICGSITNYITSGANWIHGIEFNLPPAYDVSSIVVISAPQQCSGNNGVWLWIPNTIVCSGLTVGPGFFYDVNSGGPQDGNVCNNYGDPCFGANANWSWCFQVTLNADCGGPGNPLDGTSIVPQVQVWGDGDTGSWGPTTAPCNGVGITSSPNVTMTVNCCDAESGVSPGTVPICENGTFNLIDELLPPVQTVNGTWSGPNGALPGGPNATFDPLDPIGSPPGVYTYSAVGSNGCINSTSLTMAYNTLGIIAYPAYCQLTPVPLMTLQNNPNYTLPAGGDWTNPNGDPIPSGILDPLAPLTSISGPYTYSYYDSNNCLTTAILSISLSTGSLNGGCPATIDVCSLDPPFVLLDSLGCNPAPGGQWLHNYVGPPSPGFVAFYPSSQSTVAIDPGTLAQNSTFTYALGTPPCTPTFVDLTVNMHFPANAGVFTQVSICVTDPPVVLETLLNDGGIPITPGMNWATNAGVPIPNIFDPAAEGVGFYLLNYSGGLAGTNCFAFNVMELTVLPANADAGNSNTTIVCETDPGFQLEDILLGTPQGSGVWTGPSPSTAVFNGFFIPGTTTPGVYTYTITSSCDSDFATVTVTVNTLPDPGTDDILDVCSNATNIDLFTGLGGTPDGGGTWTLAGAPVSNIINGNAVTNGAVYTYTVGTGTCTASATVTINLINAPFAGTATATPQLYCTTDATFSLFTLLTVPPSVVNGTYWTGPGVFTGASFNPATAVTGNYTYSIPDNGCGPDSETIFITVETTPNAGNNATVNACPNGVTPINLFAQLGGGVTTGGTWTAPPSGPTNGTFTPGDPAGVYTYEVESASGQCVDQATVTVNYQVIPSAGSNGAISVCADAAPFTLLSVLGTVPTPPSTPPSANWFDATPAIVPGGANAQFIPGTTTPGVFTYIIPVAGCPAVSATATITVVPLPNAGTNTTVTLCESLGSIDLTSYLNGSPDGTGTWSSGNPYDISGQGGTNQTFTYTVDNGTCTDSSTLTVNVESAPNAGTGNTLTFCSTDPCFNLNTGLTPPFTAGGTWTNGANAPTTANQCPPTIGTGDTYTYTVTGASCASATAQVVVVVDPVGATSNLNVVCSANQTDYTVTFDISGLPTPITVTGTYSQPFAGTTFTSLPIPQGTNFSFTVENSAACTDLVVSGASPVCSCPATASFSGGNQSICLGQTANLPVTLAGTGPWVVTYNNGTAVSSAPLTASGQSISVTPTVTTTYTLIGVSDANCTSTAAGSVTVTVVNPPDAGPDVTTNLCATGASLNLNTILDPTADPNGVWTNSSSTVVTNITVNAASSGVYTYTVTNAPCPADAAQYTINITDALTVTGIVTTCNAAQTQYTVEFTINGGTGPGTYSVGGNLIPGSTFTSALINVPNPYSFNIDDTGPCPQINISGAAPNCNCPATASFSGGNQTICLGQTANLPVTLGGTGPWVVTYNDGTTVSTPTLTASGQTINVTPTVTTTYSLVSVSDLNCTGTAAGSITVNVVNPPDAGPDVVEDICATGASVNLNTFLDPSADTGGTWTNSGGTVVTNITVSAASSGVYTYTVTNAPCPADAANYTFNISAPITITGLTAVCNAAQTGYTVSFTINGGTGGFTVSSPSGLTGTLTGNTFTSNLINTGTNYDFVVSDAGPCPDVPVNGASPNCNCTAVGSISGTTNICAGSCATISFSLQGNDPFDIVYQNSSDPLNLVALSGISNGHTITVCPSGNATYTLISVTDANCTGTVQGNPVTITVNPPLTITNITETCDAVGETYTVTITTNGGVDPISITPAGGTYNAGTDTYTSAPIAAGASYSFTVSNAGACPPVTVSGTFSCGCTTSSGALQTTPIVACTNETIQVVPTSGPTLDANDIFQYVLHTGTANSIGTILATSATGSFTFTGGLVAGQTYYVSAIAGNSNGQGGVNQNDPCFSATTGVSVVFNALPSASISGNSTICPGEAVNFNVNFSGSGPWNYEYTINGSTPTPGTSQTPTTTIPATTPGTYVIVMVSDNNCTGSATGTAVLANHGVPTATMAGNPDVCEGSGDGPEIAFTGTGPWTFTYAINGTIQNSITTNFPTFTIPAESSGLFSMVSVQDANCQGTASGLLSVNVIENPTGQVTGGGTVCQGNTAPFTLSLTGTGPFDVVYAVGGVPQPALTGVSNGYTFQSGVAGNYSVISVTDQHCSGQGTGEPAALQVNALPDGEVIASSNTLCIGQPLSLTFNMEGTPPYNITYVIDGDTISLNGVPNNFTQTLSPTESVFATLVYVEDSSNPSCVSTNPSSIYVQVGELLNAPVLENYTICSGSDPFEIGVEPENGMSYSWSPTTGLSNANISNPTIQLIEPGVNPRTFVYTLTSSTGDCESVTTSEITVDPGPQANFTYGPKPASAIDPTVTFDNLTLANETTAYYWEFDVFGTSTKENPTFKFPEGEEGTYGVTLTATDFATGCSDTYFDFVRIRPEMLMFVPNAFTPDGDGINDLWGPVMDNIDENEYRLTVFDRTGRIVFETLKVDQKWNGSMNNGDYYVENAVYTWLIETKNKLTSEEYEFRGIVTVVR